MLSATDTDLYENHRGGAGRAREAQGAPGAPGKGWSTGCLEEGGSLKTQNAGYRNDTENTRKVQLISV